MAFSLLVDWNDLANFATSVYQIMVFLKQIDIKMSPFVYVRWFPDKFKDDSYILYNMYRLIRII